MLFRDPPDHTRLRTLVNRAFTPRVIENLRSRIQQIVEQLLDRAQDAGAMDVIADLAYPLPVTVICDMLGVPPGDRDRIRQWSDVARSLDAIGLPADPEIVERGRSARHALGDYFRGLIPERRKRPQADLLSLLIAAEERGDRLSEGELLAMCILLGNGMLALLRHPEQLTRLRSEPALIQSAVEELLRYDSPVQRTARMTTVAVELGGRKIDEGIAFGFGIHFCLGAPLARVEGQIAIGALLTPEWRESSTLRGLKALPVMF